MPNIRIITSVISRAQRGIGRAQLNIGRASALPGLYKTTPVPSFVTIGRSVRELFSENLRGVASTPPVQARVKALPNQK